jgi:hypothetical protein
VDYEDKYEKANSNIEELIEIVVNLHKTEMTNYCVHSGEKDKCIHNCNECNEVYFEEFTEVMRQKYLV